jgi:hypothetical protein
MFNVPQRGFKVMISADEIKMKSPCFRFFLQMIIFDCVSDRMLLRACMRDFTRLFRTFGCALDRLRLENLCKRACMISLGFHYFCRTLTE